MLNVKWTCLLGSKNEISHAKFQLCFLIMLSVVYAVGSHELRIMNAHVCVSMIHAIMYVYKCFQRHHPFFCYKIVSPF